MNRLKHLKKTTKVDFLTYLGVILAFAAVTLLQSMGMVDRSVSGMLVPICCYVSMAVSLNLVVGISGELSLGHAGFMSIGAFSGVIAAMSLQSAIPSAPLRLAVAHGGGRALRRRGGVRGGHPRAAAAGGLSGHRDPGLWGDHQGAHQLPAGGL